MRWIDESDVHQGLKFDGRIAEDFKLGTGTFVSVGPLRARIIAAGAPYVQDAVITGINLREVGALIFPTPAVRRLAGLPESASLQQVLESPPVQAHFQQLVNQLADSWHRQRHPCGPVAPDAPAAVDRQGRGHRQGLDQPARGAAASRRAGQGLA